VIEASGLAEAAGAAEAAGLAGAAGVADAVEVPETDGVAEAAALADAWAAGVIAVFGVGEPAALRTSFSRTPTRRSALCLAVNTVSRRVTPKKMHPR